MLISRLLRCPGTVCVPAEKKRLWACLAHQISPFHQRHPGKSPQSESQDPMTNAELTVASCVRAVATHECMHAPCRRSSKTEPYTATGPVAGPAAGPAAAAADQPSWLSMRRTGGKAGASHRLINDTLLFDGAVPHACCRTLLLAVAEFGLICGQSRAIGGEGRAADWRKGRPSHRLINDTLLPACCRTLLLAVAEFGLICGQSRAIGGAGRAPSCASCASLLRLPPEVTICGGLEERQAPSPSHQRHPPSCMLSPSLV